MTNLHEFFELANILPMHKEVRKLKLVVVFLQKVRVLEDRDKVIATDLFLYDENLLRLLWRFSQERQFFFD